MFNMWVVLIGISVIFCVIVLLLKRYYESYVEYVKHQLSCEQNKSKISERKCFNCQTEMTATGTWNKFYQYDCPECKTKIYSRDKHEISKE